MARYEVARFGVERQVSDPRMWFSADTYKVGAGCVTFLTNGEPVVSLPLERVAYVALVDDEDVWLAR